MEFTARRTFFPGTVNSGSTSCSVLKRVSATIRRRAGDCRNRRGRYAGNGPGVPEFMRGTLMGRGFVVRGSVAGGIEREVPAEYVERRVRNSLGVGHVLLPSTGRR